MASEPLNAYDSPCWWYDFRGYFILRLSYQIKLLSVIKFFSRNFGERHLEVAVGSGTFLALALKYAKFANYSLPKQIDAIDYSAKMIAGAQKRFRRANNINVFQSNVLHLTYEDETFDSINLANAIHCFTDIRGALKELHRVLKPNGKIAVNILLYPWGKSFFARMANRLNAWGIKKGILCTPYQLSEFKKIITAMGFSIQDGLVDGNTYSVILIKAQQKTAATSSAITNHHHSKITFDYHTAFARNIGWVTEKELEILRTKRIAIAGVGGTGGIYALTMARLGIEKFNIADADIVELVNFNRQVVASMSTLNRNKTSVITDMVLEINPNSQINHFETGVDDKNLDEFLSDADIYLDGLDLFALDIRMKVFKRCRQLGIPALTAAPLGMGVSYLTFLPSAMSFEDYFQLENKPPYEQLINFLIGINPTLCSARYLAEPKAVDLKQYKTTSSMISCHLCAGVIATELLKIFLERGKVYSAPRYQVFDAYLHKHKIGWLPFGNRNIIQKFKFHLLNRILSKDKK